MACANAIGTVKPGSMAPPLLHLTDIHLTFGGTGLLDGAELMLQAGGRLCLIGRNGSGKSTLLKIASGEVEPDKGRVFLQPGTTVRYLPQEPDFSGSKTVLDYVQAGLAPGEPTGVVGCGSAHALLRSSTLPRARMTSSRMVTNKPTSTTSP